MNRSELRTRVRALTNIYSTTILSDAAINDALQDGYSKLVMSAQWPFVTVSTSITTTGGTSAYALPEGTFEVLQVSARGSYGNMRTLNPTTLFDTEVAARADNAQAPLFYVPHVGVASPTVTLIPTPAADETITVLSIRRGDPLAADVDVPEFLEEFHPVVAYIAAGQLLADRRAEATKVQALAETTAAYVDRMRRFYMTSHDHSPIRLGVARWQRWGRWHASI